MKILVLADTHGSIYEAKLAINANPDTDLVIHLGDHVRDAKRIAEMFPEIKFEIVPGNCDYIFGETDMEKVLECEGKRIMLTHGHRQYAKNGLDELSGLAEKNNADLLLYGHTHVPEVVRKNFFILLNPGSVSFPRGNSQKTYGLVEIEDGEIKAQIKQIVEK